ncbi:hypothetical protein BDV29DRAFT_183438 [Aspergillus leporis]|uniref:Uncharacterized protein n=1 Tax=Aspergillus leporis TaxID=41062 RepID=A0A5N5WMR1_9EURO|nr:hypothetical protein BDV29DRAFT_183438 [Aspergillus leporis]
MRPFSDAACSVVEQPPDVPLLSGLCIARFSFSFFLSFFSFLFRMQPTCYDSSFPC